MQKTSLYQNHLVEAFHQQFDDTQLNDSITNALAGDYQFLAYSFRIIHIDVLAALEQVSEKDDFQFYWEKSSEEFSISAAGELARIVNEGDSRFRESSTRGKKLLNNVFHCKALHHQNAEVYLFGGFSFFNENNSRNWKDFGASSFTLPKWMIVSEGKCTILTMVIPVDRSNPAADLKVKIYDYLNGLEPICNVQEYKIADHAKKPAHVLVNEQTEFDYVHWIESVKRAKSCINNGVFDKVVIARELKIELPQPISETHILHWLRRQYPDCYCFLLKHNDRASFIGCSPERLASFQSNFILTEGLAGSNSRGKTASEDAILENSLLSSTKDQHEHEIVLEAIKKQLAPYSKSIRHPQKPSVKKLSNVQHLFTPITAIINDGVSRTEVMKNLHPTPAVGGYPRDEAVTFIRKHEGFDRGWYAAPIGWINTSGNGDFAVAIRSGLIQENEVRFFAGCGIVQDSDPHKEWEETNMKFIPMLTALEYAGS